MENDADTVLGPILDSCDVCFQAIIKADQQHYKNKCGHKYCKDCLITTVTTSLGNHGYYPPQCCRRNIALDSLRVRTLLGGEVNEQIRTKEEYIASEGKLFCSHCGKWIPASTFELDTPRAVCRACSKETCRNCKGRAHEPPEPCVENFDDEEFCRLGKEKEWKRCPGCGIMVERAEGCSLMTCRCGCRFCMFCGQGIRTCQCQLSDRLGRRCMCTCFAMIVFILGFILVPLGLFEWATQ